MTSLHAPLFTTQEEIAMSAMPAAAERASNAAKPAKKRPAWKELPDEELAAHLLARPTLPDSSWSDRAGRSRRRKGESREAFVRRVLLDEEAAA